jgi:hypothetical protein
VVQSLSLVSVLYGYIEFSATVQSFVQRSFTVCDASECDRGTSLAMSKPTAIIELRETNSRMICVADVALSRLDRKYLPQFYGICLFISYKKNFENCS